MTDPIVDHMFDLFVKNNSGKEFTKEDLKKFVNDVKNVKNDIKKCKALMKLPTNTLYEDKLKLLKAKKAYADFIDVPLLNITDEIIAKTSLGINGWYDDYIRNSYSYPTQINK
jgi:hypothetical protein